MSSSSGRARPQPLTIAAATPTESSAPPNESGAITTRRGRGGIGSARLEASATFLVGGNGAHRRPQLVADLPDRQAELLTVLSDELHAAPHLGEQLQAVALLELAHGGLQDDEGHLRQVGERLVAVDAPLEVDLANRRETCLVEDVDQQPYLDRVAGEERHRLEELPSPGVLPGEGLDESGELGEEEIDEWPRHQLRDAPAALGHDPVPVADGALVEALHVGDALLTQQRAQQPVDEARLDVADVGIDPRHDIAVQHVEALPQRLTLALEAPQLGQHLRVAHDRDPELLRDLTRAIGRVRVDHHELVDQRRALHERSLDALDDEADGLFLVERRQPDT